MFTQLQVNKAKGMGLVLSPHAEGMQGEKADARVGPRASKLRDLSELCQLETVAMATKRHPISLKLTRRPSFEDFGSVLMAGGDCGWVLAGWGVSRGL